MCDYLHISPQSNKIKFSKDRVTGDILLSAEGTSIEKTGSLFCMTKVMEELPQDYLQDNWQPTCSYKKAFKIHRTFLLEEREFIFIFLNGKEEKNPTKSKQKQITHHLLQVQEP